MKVLLSIKPEFVVKILSGQKKYEFRKKIFKKEVESVVIYATSPWKAVVGEFLIEDIYELPLLELWLMTKEYAGIDESFFWKYYEGKNIGYAIKIKKIKKYKKELDIYKTFKIPPPQSYVYIFY
ncbi:hypothetical protein HPY86_04280 [candidate division WOR-3 bacterium]|nr:hypothetical protein [candidate division WOR-3 bacterium]